MDNHLVGWVDCGVVARAAGVAVLVVDGLHDVQSPWKASMSAKPVGPTWRFRIRHGNTGRWKVIVSYAPTREAAEKSVREEWPSATVFYIDAALQKKIDEESRRQMFKKLRTN